MPGKNTKSLPDWCYAAIDKMIRDETNFRAAASQVGVDLTTEEATKFQLRKEFQRAHYEARNRYFDELGSNPTRTKASALGLLYVMANRLMAEGNYKDAGEVIFKISRIEGWVGGESNVNIFGNLTAKDIDEVRKKLLTVQPPKSEVN